MRKPAVVLAVLLLAAALAGCGDSSGDVEVTPAELRNVVGIGVNQTGLQLTDEQWLAVVVQACEAGAWEWEVAGEVAAVLEVPPENLQAGATPAAAVWLMAIEACRERFPEEAIERGPPGG